MKLSYPEFAKSEGVSCLGSWCLLHGPEQHLKREALARLRAQAEAAVEGDLSWETVDGDDASARDLLNRSQTSGLFGGARVIVVVQAERIAADEQEKLSKAIGRLPPGVSVVLVTGETSDRGRGRGVSAALGRAIESSGLAVEFRRLTVDEATKWATARAKQLGKKLEPAAARKLVQQRVGTGLGEIEAELEKLALFAGDLRVIGSTHVDEVSPRLVEEDVFRLVDAVGRRNAGRAVGILRALLGDHREEPGRVLGMLAQSIRLIWQTKLLTESGWGPNREVDEETASLLPQDERKNALAQFARKRWLIRRTIGQAKAYSWDQLRQAMAALHACDLAMKGIQGKLSDEPAALELLVVQLCADLEMPVWQSPGGERRVG
ncbi:MAG: DNA polymerase III subunit delta [Armatimonadota bacterium]|nr:MAG: DNA polymerase III subunit delta [Armatimonadota bacterium]